MSQVIIGDILPYTQAVAVGSQTVFGTNWTANAASDVVVYQTPVGDAPDDVTQILAYPADYSVAFIGSEEEVQVTLVTPANAGDIITITRQTPADRENLYTNTNFLPSMLNNDFGILTLVDQQAELVNQKIGPRYNYSASIVDVIDTILPILEANQIWVKNSGNTAIEALDVPSSGFAPQDASYVTVTDETSTLPNSVNFSGQADGITIFNSAGSGSFLTRSLAATANQTTVSNATGVAGNPTIGIASNPIIPGTAGMGIPEGTTAQRVTPLSGIGLRYNTDLQKLEYYNAGWIQIEDADLSLYLLKSGGTMTGTINLNGNDASNLGILSFLNSGFTIQFTAPTLAASSSYILPDSLPPITGYVLSSTDAGVLSWIPNVAGSIVSVIGTSNEIDVDNTDPQNPVLSLSPTLDLPGTFTIQNTIDLDEIIDDDTMATATNTNIATAESTKYYTDHLTQLLDSNNNETIKFTGVASAVNEVTASNAATGNQPSLSATGDDSNIILQLNGKGTGGAAVMGTSTNDNAASGYVGELISSVISSGSAISLTNGNISDVTSISLSAGDWNVWGNISFIPNAGVTNISILIGWISQTSATLPDASLRNSNNYGAAGIVAGFDVGFSVPSLRISLSSTTTIYLSAQGNFSSTLIACGGIYARRMR